MYCSNCGKQIPENSKGLCNECEAVLNTTTVNGEKIEVIEQVGSSYSNNNNENYQAINYNSNSKNYESKSKLAAGLFAILLGAFGIHNFYLGYTGKAIAQLLITFLTCGIFSFVSAIWGFIEGILIFTGSIDKDANGVKLSD